MEQGVSSISTISNNPPSSIVDSTYAEGTNHLKSKICAFIWESNKYKGRDEWSVGTWSTKTNYRHIEMSGTSLDKSNLPMLSHNNRKRKRSNNSTITT